MRNLPIQTSNRRGFTIIEVVLVLAIAGLIFLMVFIALPNMQASQRNQQRRNDYNSLATQITNYATNHNGKAPDEIKKEWLNSQGTDPDGEDYDIEAPAEFTGTAANMTMNNRNAKQAYVYTKAVCVDGAVSTADANGIAAGKKQFVVWGFVEDGANQPGTYCLESHM